MQHQSWSQSLARRGALPLFILLFIVTLPVTLPYALIQQALVDRRKKRRAETQRCGRCGTVLGAGALTQADAVCSAYFSQLHRENPHVKFRLKRNVRAICTKCGQKYDYDEAADEFLPTDAVA